MGGTPIVTLPDWLETMTNLKFLALDRTNIETMSPYIAWLSDPQRIRKGVQNIIYLYDNIKGASRSLWREISEEYEIYLEEMEESERP